MREKLVDLIKQIVIPFWAGQIADRLISNDVVPVVRCEDCKHSTEPQCDGTCWCKGWNQHVPSEHFCSYGERKDGEG